MPDEDRAPIEVVAELLEARRVRIDDVPLAVKMFLVGFYLARETPPWKRSTIERAIEQFFPTPRPTLEDAIRSTGKQRRGRPGIDVTTTPA